MRPIKNDKEQLKISKKQSGATLFTSLIFLTLMTIVTVSATKISMVDILVAGNDQQQMEIFHQAENELIMFVKTSKLYTPLQREQSGQLFGNTKTDDKKFVFNTSPSETTETITDLEELYSCLREGIGSSIGPGTPNCKLYDFQIRKTSNTNNSIKDELHRGAGKMIPNPKSKGSYL